MALNYESQKDVEEACPDLLQALPTILPTPVLNVMDNSWFISKGSVVIKLTVYIIKDLCPSGEVCI
jgi:hypothetical protein